MILCTWLWSHVFHLQKPSFGAFNVSLLPANMGFGSKNPSKARVRPINRRLKRPISPCFPLAGLRYSNDQLHSFPPQKRPDWWDRQRDCLDSWPRWIKIPRLWETRCSSFRKVKVFLASGEVLNRHPLLHPIKGFFSRWNPPKLLQSIRNSSVLEPEVSFCDEKATKRSPFLKA